MQFEDMKAKIEGGNGFIAALDQSGGSTPKALKGYGIEEDAWTNEEEMFGLIHAMRSRIITSPVRSEEHTSELQSIMRISYAVFCLTKNTQYTNGLRAKSKHKNT